ncbi:MAG: hypothetical protein GY719_02240 [bacterium]|nr:hypothetical protein [bacterium]
MPSLIERIKRKVFELRGWIKWTVYTLLLVNFGYYFWEEWGIAMHVLRDGGTFLKWTAAFSASLDEAAWFALLFLFELETHAIPDEKFTPALERTLHAARIVAYVMLAHTIYAYGVNVWKLEYRQIVVPEVSSLCDLAGKEMSFTSNMKYTTIDAKNCGELSTASRFYQTIGEPVVTDPRGLVIEKQLGWVDLVEAVVWLLIVFSIELVVHEQNRDIAGGPMIRATNAAKGLLYGILLLVTAYWAYRGLWLYVWDELLWIGGFAVIEMNVVEWRDELLEEESQDGPTQLLRRTDRPDRERNIDQAQPG